MSQQATTSAAAPVLAFGSFRLCRAEKILFDGEQVVPIGGRAFDLLLSLADRAGDVLSRDDLVAKVWPHTVVEDSSLRVHVAALRKLLREGQDGARYIVNVPGRGYSFVAPVSAATIPNAVYTPNHHPVPLPVRVNRIIGRDDIVRTLQAQLRLRRRLVTLAGHGGMGKTTVALAVAEAVRSDYADGIYFVDLAPLSDPQHVPAALASAVGAALGADDPSQMLAAFLRPRQVLIVLDNCEHVIDAASTLAEQLIRDTAGVDILATSREPLDAEGEWLHRLPALAMPDAAQAPCAATLAQYPAVQLFVERAGASLSSFALTDDNAAAIERICRHLDGVPLALEFAAARIELLGVQGVAEQLTDRLRLLASGRRTAVPRHRTLRALLDWSHTLLSADEQTVLARLGVFRGPFTLQAACVVLGDQRTAPALVTDSVLSLLSKSFLSVDTQGELVCYSLLEITRAYALEKLDAEPDRELIFLRHAQHMNALLRQSELDWELMTRARWHATYLPQANNARAALSWAFGPGGEQALGVALVSSSLLSMVPFFGNAELRQLLHQALASAAAGTVVSAANQARIRTILAYVDQRWSDAQPEFHPCYHEALEQAERQGDARALIETRYFMFSKTCGSGIFQLAEQHAELAEVAAQAAGDRMAMLLTGRMVSQAGHFMGRHDKARLLAERVLQQESARLPLGYSSPLPHSVSLRIVLARVLWMQGRTDQAVRMAAESVALAAKEEHHMASCHALGLAACPIALWCGDEQQARLLIGQLLQITLRHAISYWQAWGLRYQEVLEQRSAPVPFGQQDPYGEPGSEMLRDHLATFEPALLKSRTLVRVEQGMVGWCSAETLRAHGENLLSVGHPEAASQAEALFLRALEIAEQQQAPAWGLRAATSLAQLWQAQGRAHCAHALLASHCNRIVEGQDSADPRKARRLLTELGA